MSMRSSAAALASLGLLLLAALASAEPLACAGACEPLAVPSGYPILLPAGLCPLSASAAPSAISTARDAANAAVAAAYASEAARHAALFNGTWTSSFGFCAGAGAGSASGPAVRARLCALGTEGYYLAAAPAARAAVYALNATSASDCVVPRDAVASFAYVYSQQRGAGLLPALGSTPTPTPAPAGGGEPGPISGARPGASPAAAALAASLLAAAAAIALLP